MNHIVLISCVKSKAPHLSLSRDLYRSDLFRKSLAYARLMSPDQIFVLSAKYGLVDLEREIEPYDETLNTMAIAEVEDWAKLVLKELKKVSSIEDDRFTFLASVRYRRFLLPHLPHHDVPMKGLRIGEQLRYLREQIP